jgi:hypothetical protein
VLKAGSHKFIEANLESFPMRLAKNFKKEQGKPFEVMKNTEFKHLIVKPLYCVDGETDEK